MYSNNVIFISGNLFGINSKEDDFEEIAIVKLDGSELYLRTDQDEDIIEKIYKFLGGLTNKKRDYIIMDTTRTNWEDLCENFGLINSPWLYFPIDFGSILWCKDVDPDVVRETLAKKKGIDAPKSSNNVLDEARTFRDIYLYLEKSPPKSSDTCYFDDQFIHDPHKSDHDKLYGDM